MGLEDPRKSRSRIRSAVEIAFYVCAVAFMILMGCSRDSGSRIRVELRDLPQAKPTTETEPQDSCTAADPIPTLGPSSLWAGHHVTLSWHPSTSANGPNGKNIRYCVYRTKGGPVHPAQTQNGTPGPPCINCQRITEVAVNGTTAFDSQLEIGARYCYVAVAIDISNRKRSTFLNPAAVVIPPATDPPSCNLQSDAKQANQAVLNCS